MDHLGHGLALQHSIFNTPHASEFEYLEQDRPKHYEGMTSPLWPEGVPARYRLAKFEKDKPKGWNPTLVSHEGFFTDVPGFENLAEGNSAKMLGSLALARQGRWFYWGYSIDPQEMTTGAADTLVNVLYYMHGKRDSRTVPFVCKTRKRLRVLSFLAEDKGYKRGVQEHLPGSLTPEWRETYTPTFPGAKAWVAKYLPYVFSGKSEKHRGKRYKTVFEVDRDAMALGTPNNDAASLAKWILLVAKDADPEKRARALRCLRRYVHPSLAPKDGQGWGQWHAEFGAHLVFVDSTGFWWQLDPNSDFARKRTQAK